MDRGIFLKCIPFLGSLSVISSLAKKEENNVEGMGDDIEEMLDPAEFRRRLLNEMIICKGKPIDLDFIGGFFPMK